MAAGIDIENHMASVELKSTIRSYEVKFIDLEYHRVIAEVRETFEENMPASSRWTVVNTEIDGKACPTEAVNEKDIIALVKALLSK